MSNVVNALTAEETSKLNQLLNEYGENREAFKKDANKKAQIAGLIRKYYAEKYNDEVDTVTDQKRLERIQQIMTKYCSRSCVKRGCE